jgi:hypothetical protein
MKINWRLVRKDLPSIFVGLTMPIWLLPAMIFCMLQWAFLTLWDRWTES